jgi:hypothetical protein
MTRRRAPVVIQGVAAENLTLTADTSGVIEADGIGAVSYQWAA